MKTILDVHQLPRMLTLGEVECLFRLGQFNEDDGVIVEIGSWKGKSTVALGLGAVSVHNEPVYAIDPHRVLPEEGYLEDTEADFLANIEQAGLDGHVIPLIMTSAQAAQGWDNRSAYFGSTATTATRP